MPAALTFYIAWLWFGETGYQGVFIRTFTAQATLGGSAIAAAFAVLWLNVRVDRRMISPPGAANVGVEVRIELIPRLPLITLIMISQVANGILLPFVLLYMLKLVNRADLMGSYKNS